MEINSKASSSSLHDFVEKNRKKNQLNDLRTKSQNDNSYNSKNSSNYSKNVDYNGIYKFIPG
jgi:hypothetical protein